MTTSSKLESFVSLSQETFVVLPTALYNRRDEDPSSQACDAESIARLVGEIVASAEPAIVFRSLAAVSVPAVADECIIVFADDDVVNGQSAAGSPVPADTTPEVFASNSAGTSLTLDFAGQPDGDAPAYRVAVIYRWQRCEVTGAHRAAARLLGERAVALVRQERLSCELERQIHKSEQLTEALVTSRQIGQALGIVMCTYKLTSEQAFDLLRAVSQKTHRKLREVADDVNFTGTLTVLQLEPTAPRRLKVVDSS